MSESKEKPFCVITAEVYRLQQDKTEAMAERELGL
jgi:hypothetical protein